MRCFISIDMPEEVQKEIKKIQDNLPEFIGKKTEFENLHLTLKFLGEIDEEKIEEIKKRVREIEFKDFDAKIDFIGVFSEKFIRIIWLHLKGPEELQKQIDQRLMGLFEPEARFMSHLTIARVKAVKGKREEFLKKIKQMKIPKISFNVRDFRLKKSRLTEQGPIYNDIERYILS